ncbi:hypothetical protein RDV64_12615 [Acuticoccus sp. MNP-M23]|uniref:hypothetical protein n=1 Tax=Acuticoccus sp. MNP-M23 TaxID=3072793 RepID=UPI002815B7CA|nr:hypothetical protein [Acuticoccus sp. MNP-M23]WMS40934.1 hypothetical protein RDV64_12615 [Acuticoccus sp. MNP-M23]
MLTLARLILVWACVYPLVTFALLAFDWAELHMSLPLKTLLLTAALVPLNALAIVPLVNTVWRRSFQNR